MSTRDWTFDDESVDGAVTAFGEGRRQHVARNDAEELRPPEHLVAQVPLRIESKDRRRIEVSAANDLHGHLGFLSSRQLLQDPRDARRNARAHHHVVDVGQNRTEQCCQRGDLNLGEQIDADETVVTLFGESNLDERRKHEQVDRSLRTAQREHRYAAVGLVLGTSRGRVLAQNVVDDRTNGKTVQHSLQRGVDSLILQSTSKHGVDSGTRNHTQLARECDGSRERPTRYRDTHASLNEPRQWGRVFRERRVHFTPAWREPPMVGLGDRSGFRALRSERCTGPRLAGTGERLREFVSMSTSLLQRYCNQVLLHESRVFRQVDRQRTRDQFLDFRSFSHRRVHRIAPGVGQLVT